MKPEERSSLWKSTGLRLAAMFGFLVLLGMLAALALVYLQVSAVLHQNVERQLQQDLQRFASAYERAGATAASEAIARRLDDGKDTDAELMLLLDSQGRRLAGNLHADSISIPAIGMQGMHRIQRDGAGINAQIAVHRLDDGALLIVGHDLRELRDIESTVATASVIAGVFALLLAAAGTWLFRRELARSVGAMHNTIMHVSGGRMQSRVAIEGSANDEFAQLEQDFNHMLDHIEQLMSGVQHVSDTVAHNVRTPLTRIQLRLQSALLGPESNDSSQLRSSMSDAMQEIDSLSQMLEKLLQIAQAESGMRRQPFEELNWRAIAQEVVELYEDLAQDEDINIVWHCEHEAPLLGDHSILAGAVVNILDNAIKYAGAGSTLVITTRVSGTPAFSELLIRDNGASLPASDIEQLGQRFVRLNPELPGHGLGMASVRAMMHLHGGEMRVASANPGLEVCLRLPSITLLKHTHKPHKSTSNITVLQ